MTGRVFWTLVGACLLGVGVCSFLVVPLLFALFLAGLGVIALVYTLLYRRAAIALLIATASLAFSLGVFRMDVAFVIPDATLAAHINQRITIEGTVRAEPDARDHNDRLSVQVVRMSYEDTTSSVAAGILVVVPTHSGVSYGDTIRASGMLRVPEKFDTGVGRQFNYPQYLAMQGIEYQLSPAHIDEMHAGTGNPLAAGAIWIKETFLRGLATALPEPEAGFAGGITVGDKRSIGPDLSADFQKVGLIHMIVLSGYNITVVIDAAKWLLDRTPFLKSLRYGPMGASGAIVALFVLMSGGASSAARSGLMALIAVYAHTSRRVFFASRALGAAALALVIWNPYVLAFDPGFQLSMLATVGLIVFSPLVAARMQWVTTAWGLREIASSTIGTQIAVLPLLLYQNGQLPIYALPANLLTLVFVPYAMLWSLVAGIAGLLFGPASVVVALPALVLLKYIIIAAQFIAALPYASVSIAAFNPIWMFFAYAILFIGAVYLHKKGAAAQSAAA